MRGYCCPWLHFVTRTTGPPACCSPGWRRNSPRTAYIKRNWIAFSVKSVRFSLSSLGVGKLTLNTDFTVANHRKIHPAMPRVDCSRVPLGVRYSGFHGLSPTHLHFSFVHSLQGGSMAFAS